MSEVSTAAFWKKRTNGVIALTLAPIETGMCMRVDVIALLCFGVHLACASLFASLRHSSPEPVIVPPNPFGFWRTPIRESITLLLRHVRCRLSLAGTGMRISAPVMS